jgi:Protein of unknown function (DUF2934)
VFKKEVALELLTTAQKNPFPLIGMNPSVESCGDDKFSRTALCAYYKAQRRNFAPGHEIEDWLDAEAEIEEEDDR